MKEIIIEENEAGQRFDKFLSKYLSQAPKGFIYKMLRKKNITLNKKKASGNEKLILGDTVLFFLSEETIAKFSRALYPDVLQIPLDIIYEDPHILLINKPVGMLSQKSGKNDVSLVEYVTGYLLGNQSITKEMLRSFRPAVCNRLDRNTSGIVAAGKSLVGLQVLSAMFRMRSLNKYYLCLTAGKIKEKACLKGYFHKNDKTNKVTISSEPIAAGLPVETEYKPISGNEQLTLLEVKLITGRSHQIRSHLASIGHPVIGDPKYGDTIWNQRFFKKYKLTHQLLHAYKIQMPIICGELSYLSNQTFKASLPDIFARILREEQFKEDI